MQDQRVIDNTEWRWVFISSALLLILIALPFVWAYGVGAPNARFMGVLVNPQDGASYQAKMYQGWSGSWMVHLPYTPEQHRGVLLFTFYLAMGQLARLLNLSPILIFHVMRLIGGLVMFLAFYRFAADWTDDVQQRRVTWALGVLGAGFGWIALLFGYVSPDLLILPEAFPLQAAYANPHFPWAIAIALTMVHVLVKKCLTETDQPPVLNSEAFVLATGALFLVSVSPFVLVPIGVGYIALLIALWRRYRQFPLRSLSWGSIVLIFGLPLAAYNAWAVSSANPIFQAWMRQNVTSSPPVWDYLIAFGPLLAMAIAGVWGSRNNLQDGDVFLLAWIVSTVLLLYAPLGLQRRFSMGLIAPLAIYAGRGLWRVLIPRFAPRYDLLGVVLAFALFIPTTIMALVTPMIGALSFKESSLGYFLTRSEIEALDWLEANGGQRHALVLASPEVSLFVPMHGLRVVYGHPYETLNATARRQAVADFYTGARCEVIATEGVDYVLVGSRELKLAGDAAAMCPLPDDPVFTSSDGQVRVYAVFGD